MAGLGSIEPDHADGVAPEIDTSKPHPARVYDYFLGGKDNFAADRETAQLAMKAWPDIRTAARENRAFLGRAVRYLAEEAGITQFLDLGSGLPSVGNVHEVAQDVVPSAHVMYVDNDPIVLAHARALLASKPDGKCAYIQADLRDPQAVLAHPVTRETLDFDKPIALVLAAVVHLIPDEDEPGRIISTLIDALPSGSHVIASHATAEYVPNAEAVDRIYNQRGIRGGFRPADEFASLVFTGLTLVPPGVVLVSEWRPEPGAILPAAVEVGVNGGVARKA
jgi:hypothetical protein